MTSSSTSALASLDDCLAHLRENLVELTAAKSVNVAEVIEQVKRATECAGMVRESVWAELPEASWQNREELDALIAETQKILQARALEQLRSRLLALATEFERGSIVHRRAHRLSELNQLRDQAIHELRSQAGLDGAPQTLPGPPADQWLGWACGLREPEDAAALEALRVGFPHLDDFVANLEPHLWEAAPLLAVEVLEPEEPAGGAPPKPFPPEKTRFDVPVVASGPIPVELQEAMAQRGRRKPGMSDPRDALPLLGLESNTLTPQDVTPPRTEEEVEQIQARERALLSGMMGLISDPAGHFDPTAAPLTRVIFPRNERPPKNVVSDPGSPQPPRRD
jgi:hypothetical protein